MVYINWIFLLLLKYIIVTLPLKEAQKVRNLTTVSI